MGPHKYLDVNVRIWAAGDSIRLTVDGRKQPMYVPKDSALYKHLRKMTDEKGWEKNDV